MLAAPVPAGIEAPIRFYVTEEADGKASLSYRTPDAVFVPYLAEATPDLRLLAVELDAIVAKIADDVTRP